MGKNFNRGDQVTAGLCEGFDEEDVYVVCAVRTMVSSLGMELQVLLAVPGDDIPSPEAIDHWRNRRSAGRRIMGWVPAALCTKAGTPVITVAPKTVYKGQRYTGGQQYVAVMFERSEKRSQYIGGATFWKTVFDDREAAHDEANYLTSHHCGYLGSVWYQVVAFRRGMRWSE